MSKTIRRTYPLHISVGMLIIIFIITYFLSFQLFGKIPDNVEWYQDSYFGGFLVSCAILVMVLMLWEELLFPVKIKDVDGGNLYRNHREKLVVQALMYLIIPAVVAYLYLNFPVSGFRFYAWAGINVLLPVAGKLITGLNNYNDFLELTDKHIRFKDNEHEGTIALSSVSSLELVRDEDGFLHELKIALKEGDPVVIEVHQMELEDFFESIEAYIGENYKGFLKG